MIYAIILLLLWYNYTPWDFTGIKINKKGTEKLEKTKKSSNFILF